MNQQPAKTMATKSPSEKVGVLISDEFSLVRERFCSLLMEDARIAVVGQASSAVEMWRLFIERQPDAVVFDFGGGQGGGLEALRQLKKADPGCVVMVLTNHRGDEFRRECRRLGADFFLHKATEFEKAAEVLGRLPCRVQARRAGPPVVAPASARVAHVPAEPVSPEKPMPTPNWRSAANPEREVL